MDKIRICEAMYALPGEDRGATSQIPRAACRTVRCGVVLLVLNHVYGAELSNNMRSALVFLGGSLALAGMITLAARVFSAPKGRPITVRGVVTCATTSSISSADWPQRSGSASHRRCGAAFRPASRAGARCGRGRLPDARQPLRGHAGVRVRRPGVQAADRTAHCRRARDANS